MIPLQNLILSSKALCLPFCSVVVMESTKSISDTLFLAALKITTEKITCELHVPRVLCSQPTGPSHVTGVTFSPSMETSHICGNWNNNWQLMPEVFSTV